MKIKPFKSSIKTRKRITRITDYRSVLEFIRDRKLYFSPLSAFEDFTEGKRFEDIEQASGGNISTQQHDTKPQPAPLYYSA
jgi:hypothetical protein